MGLLMKCEAKDSPYGAEILQAYVRVEAIRSSKVTSIADLAMYVSRSAYLAGAMPLRRWGIGIPTDRLTGPLWTAAYTTLKTQYTDAVDVLNDVDPSPTSAAPTGAPLQNLYTVHPLQTPRSETPPVQAPTAVKDAEATS